MNKSIPRKFQWVNVLNKHSENDFDLWQAELPVQLMDSCPKEIVTVSDDIYAIMDSVPLFDESGRIMYLLSADGNNISCAKMVMPDGFFNKYVNDGSSVRGSREDIKEEIKDEFEISET